MWSLLKKFFQTKRETGQVDLPQEISLEDLPGWFEKKAKTRWDVLLGEIKELQYSLDKKKSEVEEAIDALQNATLPNPSISVKEKQYLEGNRSSYIMGTSQFLKSLAIPDEHGQILQYPGLFTQNLEKYAKATVRPYQILQQFLAHEGRDVAIAIKGIEDIHITLAEKIKSSNMGSIKAAQEAIAQLSHRTLKKNELKNSIAAVEKDLAAAKEELAKHEKALTALQASHPYKNMLELKAEREVLHKQLKDAQDDVLQQFSILDDALKKFGRLSLEDEEIISQYLFDPAEALEKDEDIQMGAILNKIKDALEKNQIVLKEKKRAKTVSLLESLSSAALKQSREAIVGIKRKMIDLGENLKENPALQKEQMLQDAIRQDQHLLSQSQRKYENLQKDYGEINIGPLKDQVACLVRETININITLKENPPGD